MTQMRIEKDSLGEIQVPLEALYGAQTQRAVNNFPIDIRFPSRFLIALAHVKLACCRANMDLGLLTPDLGHVIEATLKDLIENFDTPKYINAFPVSVYQTGSGTSTNMNMNEVVAHLSSSSRSGSSIQVHPNDHVNMSQSSNDVIPSSMHVAAYMGIIEDVLPALRHLVSTLDQKGQKLSDVIKTGRTHLMDAMPITLGQELSGWSAQITKGIERLEDVLRRVAELAIGGTAVGSGINAPPAFGPAVATYLTQQLLNNNDRRPSQVLPFVQNANLFQALSAPDAIVELSAALKVTAVSLMKISNDLRWMNSGPIAGLGEIVLPVLQPGSSIMPGKVNPVIPEAVAMACARVMGNDTTTTIAGQSGSFQLNVMFPVLIQSVLESQMLITNSSRMLADQAIAGFEVQEEHMMTQVCI